MTNEEVIKVSNEVLAQTYGRFPVVLVKGKGCRVWDVEGKEYLDFVAGIGVCNLGHCHPKVVQAIREQAGKLLHVSNLYHIGPQIELAQLLVKHSFADRVFFCNSGTEANEAAIKLARKYSQDHYGPGRYEIISLLKSFHGRTLGALAATGQEKFHKGFEPMMTGFKYVPREDLAAMEAAITEATCAILVEPIQAEGGVNLFSENYLKGLRQLCDQKKLVLIFDEVQVGMGRTGKLFAYEHYGVPPDIMTMAKGLAGGVPIGATLAKDEVAKSFTPGSHAATFGGNPLSTAAGVAALRATIEDGILENCQRSSAHFLKRLEELKKKHSFIRDVRGKGLMIGLELDREGKNVVTDCLKKGFLINCTDETVLRFIPPLIVTPEEIDRLIMALGEVFSTWSWS
ncbi:MAG: acetylornithine transaminase [Deltaproteobacteria bacterium]|nr:acetylornithine transaminase [Deltaproteobacteria bacterium]